MTGSPLYHKIATPFCVLLVSLTVTAAPRPCRVVGQSQVDCPATGKRRLDQSHRRLHGRNP